MSDDGELELLQRRRQRRARDRFNRRILFGAGAALLLLAVVLVVGAGSRWREARSRTSEQARQPAKDRTTGKSSPPPSPPDRTRTEVPPPVRSQHQTDGIFFDAVGVLSPWICTAVVLVGGGVVGWRLLNPSVNVCPHCNKNRAVYCADTVVHPPRKCYSLVTRTARSTSRTSSTQYGTTSDGRPVRTSGTGVTQGQTEWEERVPVIRTVYTHTMRCRFCMKAWEEEKVEEVEDFDPHEPLPPPANAQNG